MLLYTHNQTPLGGDTRHPIQTKFKSELSEEALLPPRPHVLVFVTAGELATALNSAVVGSISNISGYKDSQTKRISFDIGRVLDLLEANPSSALAAIDLLTEQFGYSLDAVLELACGVGGRIAEQGGQIQTLISKLKEKAENHNHPEDFIYPTTQHGFIELAPRLARQLHGSLTVGIERLDRLCELFDEVAQNGSPKRQELFNDLLDDIKFGRFSNPPTKEIDFHAAARIMTSYRAEVGAVRGLFTRDSDASSWEVKIEAVDVPRFLAVLGSLTIALVSSVRIENAYMRAQFYEEKSGLKRIAGVYNFYHWLYDRGRENGLALKAANLAGVHSRLLRKASLLAFDPELASKPHRMNWSGKIVPAKPTDRLEDHHSTSRAS